MKTIQVTKLEKEGTKEPYSGKSDSDFYADIQNQSNQYMSGIYDELKNMEYYRDVEEEKNKKNSCLIDQ